MHDIKSLEGRTVVITGANSGIGFAASQQLALHGATVVMACRNPERGKTAAEAVRQATGNEHVQWIQLDLTSTTSIQCFVEEYLAHFDTLDVLINNAANFDISLKKPVLTETGAETIFATNYLGPFYLTYLLTDLLVASAPARVINISSKGLLVHPFLKIQFDDLTTSQKRRYSPSFAYYHSKLALLMYTRKCARRLQENEVTVNAIRVPNVSLDAGRFANINPVLMKMYKVKQRFAISPSQMAETYVSLASEAEYTRVTGQYFDEHCKTVNYPKAAMDDQACTRLWDMTTEILGIED